MDIELSKDFIKEVKREFRNRYNTCCGTYIRIDIENKLIVFSFHRHTNSKYTNERETNVILQDKINVNCNTNVKRIHLHIIDFNDVFLDVLLSEKVFIELYKKNIDGFVQKETNTECYLSTIKIHNGKKRATYSIICNKHCDMIVD